MLIGGGFYTTLVSLRGYIPLLIPPVATRFASLFRNMWKERQRRRFSPEAVNTGLNTPQTVLPASHGWTFSAGVFLEVAKLTGEKIRHTQTIPNFCNRRCLSGSSQVEHVYSSCAMNGRLVRHYRSFTIRHSFSNPHPSLPFALLAASLSLCSEVTLFIRLLPQLN